MDCADVRDALARGELPEGPKLTVHLRTCDACSELLADGAALGRGLADLGRSDAPADVDAMGQLLEQSLARERGLAATLRSWPTLARMGAALVGAALIAALVLAFRRRADLEVYPLDRLVPAVGAYALLVGAAVRVALRPLHLHALPIVYRLGVALAAVLVPFVIAAAPAAHAAHPASLGGVGADLVPRAAQCFAFGCAVAMPPLLLFWALDRGGHRAWPGALAAAAGAGLIGILSLELHCPLTHPAHLIAGHATVGSALVVTYGLVTWLRRRGAARAG